MIKSYCSPRNPGPEIDGNVPDRPSRWEIMLENQWERLKRVDMQQIIKYRPVPGVPVVLKHYFLPEIIESTVNHPVSWRN